jgi:hypothetical protein
MASSSVSRPIKPARGGDLIFERALLLRAVDLLQYVWFSNLMLISFFQRRKGLQQNFKTSISLGGAFGELD